MLIIRRSKLHYTASGIVTPIGVMIPDDDEINNSRFLRSYFTLDVS